MIGNPDGTGSDGGVRPRGKRPKKTPIGVRPRVRIIVESDTRETIHLPKGVRWRAEKIVIDNQAGAK